MNDISIILQIAINKKFALLLFFATMIFLISYGIEIFSEIEPCKLCIAQRFIFLLIGISAFAGIFSNAKRIFILVIFVISIFGFVIALYHTGIQLDFFTDTCNLTIPQDIYDLKNLIFKKPSSCSKIDYFLKIPFSAWSGVSTFLFLGLTFYMLSKHK